VRDTLRNVWPATFWIHSVPLLWLVDWVLSIYLSARLMACRGVMIMAGDVTAQEEARHAQVIRTIPTAHPLRVHHSMPVATHSRASQFCPGWPLPGINCESDRSGRGVCSLSLWMQEFASKQAEYQKRSVQHALQAAQL
jgi:hypothetical protein